MILTVEECAEKLRVNTGSVLDLITRGELKAKLIGNQYRITNQSLYEYLDLDIIPIVEHATITFTFWADKWLEIYKKPHVTENTYEGTYRLYVEKHLKPFFGTMDLTAIKPSHIQEFLMEKLYLSESSLNKIKICLKGIFETAVENDLCNKNPARHMIAKSTKTSYKKRVYTAEQESFVCKIALEKLPGIVLCLETGLRPGEFTGLQWSDINDSILHVSRSIAYSKPKTFIVRPPKWNSYRDIPLSPLALEALECLKNEDVYVYPKDKNVPYTPRTWDKTVARFFEQYPSLVRLAPHEFRHTFGTKLRRRGVDIYTIQKLMGHKTIKVTTETYVHNETDVLKRAMGL